VGDDTPARGGEILDTIRILAHSLRIGRPVRDGTRELVIGRQGRASWRCIGMLQASTRHSCWHFEASEEGYKR